MINEKRHPWPFKPIANGASFYFFPHSFSRISDALLITPVYICIP